MIAIIPLVVGAISVGLISVISQSSAVSKKVSDSGDASRGDELRQRCAERIDGHDGSHDHGPRSMREQPADTEPSQGRHGDLVRRSPTGNEPPLQPCSVLLSGHDVRNATRFRSDLIASLSVPALLIVVASGDQLTIGVGSTSQTVTASSAAAIGATSISVKSFTSSSNQAAGIIVLELSKLATPSGTAVVSHDVQSTLGALIGGQSCNPVSFSCTPSPSWSTAWWYADGISGISIAISATQSNYHYTLVGVPRVSNNSSTGGASPGHPQFIGLSSSGTAIARKGNER